MLLTKLFSILVFLLFFFSVVGNAQANRTSFWYVTSDKNCDISQTIRKIVSKNTEIPRYKILLTNRENRNCPDCTFRVAIYPIANDGRHYKLTDAQGNIVPFCYETSNLECTTQKGSGLSGAIWLKINLGPNETKVLYLKEVSTDQTSPPTSIFAVYYAFREGDDEERNRFMNEWRNGTLRFPSVNWAMYANMLEIWPSTQGTWCALAHKNAYSATPNGRKVHYETKFSIASSRSGEPHVFFLADVNDFYNNVNTSNRVGLKVAMYNSGRIIMQYQVNGAFNHYYSSKYYSSNNYRRILIINTDNSIFEVYYDGVKILTLSRLPFTDIHLRMWVGQETVRYDWIRVYYSVPHNATIQTL